MNVDEIKKTKAGRAWLAAYVRRLHEHVLDQPLRDVLARAKTDVARDALTRPRKLQAIAADLVRWSAGKRWRLTPFGRQVAIYCRRQRWRR